jgi:formylglycine-generating enzyme required for sulfatase activity
MKRANIHSLRGAFDTTTSSRRSSGKQSPACWGLLRAAAHAMTLIILVACTPVDLYTPVPDYNTGVDPNAWAMIPMGSFLAGQFDDPASINYDYEIMITDVTMAQYVGFLNTALADGILKVEGDMVTGFYPGDAFHAAKHEVAITATNYIFVPLNDRASRFAFDGSTFSIVAGYENHPMTNVSWFGAWGYCGYFGARLPTESEWEKAARGSVDKRPFPWGSEIASNNANFYTSRDPFEDMHNIGSRTTPVGFYNGKTYDSYATLNSASPYGLYDMAGNVWQWTGNVYEGQHYRYLRGGSKDTYTMDLRIWVRNNATPTYYSPGVGFRCARNP